MQLRRKTNKISKLTAFFEWRIYMKIIADENIPFVKKCFSTIGDVVTISGRDITASAVRDADILLVRSITTVDEGLLAESSVKFVATATIGFEHIDADVLNRRNIGFASAPGSNANSVAEYVTAALLEIAEKNNIVLADKSIGIIGVGNVGSRVEKKCRALGMKVLLNDPPLFRKTGNQKYLPIEKLFDCDFLTLHTPLTFKGIDKTYHLADYKFFDSVKKGCVFINTARGPVMNSQALKDKIKAGIVKAAVLDVWENEPDIDTELLELADIATAHIAGYSLDGKVAGLIMIYSAACDYLGVKAASTAGDFLPKPKVPALKIEAEDNEQQILHSLVPQIYDIKKDDQALRKLLKLPADKKAAWFDRLRKEYPERREFSNTKVAVKNAGEGLIEKIKGIGFQAK